MMAWLYFDLTSIFVCLFDLLLLSLLLTMAYIIAQIFSTQVNMFLKEYTRVRKLLKKNRKSKKRSKIEEETTVETEAKRLKILNLEEKSFKLCPKSTLANPAQKTLMENSKILLGPKPKTCSKAPPALFPTLLGPPVKRKGPGRQ